MVSFTLMPLEAEMLRNLFLPYMKLNVVTDMNNNAGNDLQFLSYKIVRSLLNDFEVMLEIKWIKKPKKYIFKLTDAHNCAFYVYLMKRPVDRYQHFALHFRQQLCDQLYRQLFNDRPLVHESVPVTMADYELGE